MEEMEPAVFGALLCYIYTSNILDIEKPLLTVLIQKLISVADQYLIDQLKDICETKLCDFITENNVVVFLDFSECTTAISLDILAYTAFIAPELWP